MRPIFTSLSPNAESDDVWLAFRLLFFPASKKRGESSRETLEVFFKKYLGMRFAYATESGRSALWAILSALHLGGGEEVLMQSYTCVAVPNAVVWAHGNPVYVDIEPDTFTMSPEDLIKKISPRSRVLIIQHTFGNPANISRLLEIARLHNLFVIEDCAHALGAEYQGKKVGTFGDASFFSFGRDKVISSIFGGIAVTNDEVFAPRLEEVYCYFGEAKPQWVRQQLFHPIIMSLVKATYQWFGLGRLLLAFLRYLKIISRAVERQEKFGMRPDFFGKKMPEALAALARNQLKKLDRFNVHRREIAHAYQKKLEGVQGIVLPQEVTQGTHIFLRYTIRVSYAERMIAAARKKNIYLGDWYNFGVAPAGVDYKKIFYKETMCPNAERAARESVNLPTDINISKKDTEWITQFLLSYHL